MPAEVNERTCAFTDELGCRIGEHLDEPSELLREPWFVDNVLLHPTVAGALRALLGDGFGLPIIVSNHRVTTPAPAQQWHHVSHQPLRCPSRVPPQQGDGLLRPSRCRSSRRCPPQGDGCGDTGRR